MKVKIVNLMILIIVKTEINIYFKMERSIKGNGKAIIDMVMERRNGQMALSL
jgi:hypothetical protein